MKGSGDNERYQAADYRFHGLQGITVALEDGAAHAVDSSELAFKLAAQYAFRSAFTKANPVILEPMMTVQVQFRKRQHFSSELNCCALQPLTFQISKCELSE